LIILTLIMMIISLFVFVFNNRNKESIWLSGLFIGFILANIGLMFYYAKMGGLIYNEQIFFFLTINIRQYIQRFIITIDNISRLLLWGRSIFLYFLMMFALHLVGILQKRRLAGLFALVLPLFHSIAADPLLLKSFSSDQRDSLYILGNIYMAAYLFISIVLIIKEYFNQNIRWVKKQLRYIILFVTNMILYFVIFCQINPLSMMYYSKYALFDIGFKFYKLRFSITAWYLLLGLFAFFIIMGLFALFRFTSIVKKEHQDNIFLERQLNIAQLGIQVFIHGIKNQLFSEQIILRHLTQDMDSTGVNPDEIKHCIAELHSINENMTTRIEKLYQVFRQNTMSLAPCRLSAVVDNALERLSSRLGAIDCEFRNTYDPMILADMPYLSEAVYNILSNACSAVKAGDRAGCGKIIITIKEDHHWCAVRIEDNGIGMSKAKLKKIFEPFYTDKNSNYNWGIGLTYVKQIVKLHFGKLHVESQENAGTVFILAFPILQASKAKKKSTFSLKRQISDKTNNEG